MEGGGGGQECLGPLEYIRMPPALGFHVKQAWVTMPARGKGGGGSSRVFEQILGYEAGYEGKTRASRGNT